MEPDAEDGLHDCAPYLLNQPGIDTFLSNMRDQVFKKYDSMTVAEVDVPDADLERYIGENGYFSMVFDFSYADIDTKGVTRPCDFAPWNLADLKHCIFHGREDASISAGRRRIWRTTTSRALSTNICRTARLTFTAPQCLACCISSCAERRTSIRDRRSA